MPAVPLRICPLIPILPRFSTDLLLSWSTWRQILHSHIHGPFLGFLTLEFIGTLAEAATWNLFFHLFSPGVCSVLQLKLTCTLVKCVCFYWQDIRQEESGACSALVPQGTLFGAQFALPMQLADRVGCRKAQGIPGCCNSKIGDQELSWHSSTAHGCIRHWFT